MNKIGYPDGDTWVSPGDAEWDAGVAEEYAQRIARQKELGIGLTEAERLAHRLADAEAERNQLAEELAEFRSPVVLEDPSAAFHRTFEEAKAEGKTKDDAVLLAMKAKRAAVAAAAGRAPAEVLVPAPAWPGGGPSQTQ